MRTQTLECHDEQGRAPERSTGARHYDAGWLRERIGGYWALAVGVGWFVLAQAAAAFEPATSRAEPAIGVVLAVVMWTLIAVMATGLAMQRRWGIGAALAASALFAAAVIACPTTGHHTFGVWWFGEAACAAAMVGISAYALQRAPRVEREPATDTR
jgi:peptidoglycan/LPS O-acetylase OafA/YrhL